MKTIAALIVTYNPNLERLKNTVSMLKKEVNYLIIVDNYSDNQKAIIDGFDDVYLIDLKINSGIAAAQNKGIICAMDHGCDGVIFFDQDSEPESDLTESLKNSFNQLSAGRKIAAIGPIHKDKRLDFIYPVIRINNFGWVKKLNPEKCSAPEKVDLLISSGTLISTEALHMVGLMNEGLFIDYVDTEWCLRARHAKFELYIEPTCTLTHEIGENIWKIGSFFIPVHSPSRRYYRIRNAYKLLAFKHFPKMLCIKEIIQNMLHQALLIIISNKRLDYLKYAYKGTKDGLLEVRNSR